ncbi:MAG: glycosyltransferase family 4 protein, partial [Candidatus Helarchaeota archaeon]
YILSKIKKTTFIFEIRELWTKFAIETGVLNNSLAVFLAGFLEKFIYKRADYFIINSPGFYKHLEKFGVAKNKTFLIPNGVDTKIFKPDNKYNQVRKEFNLNKNFVVLYSGAHGLANSLDTIIESARLLKDRSDIKFLFVGDGKEKRHLVLIRDKYKLKNVIFVDAQSKSKMPEYCNAADVCLATLKKLDSFKTTYPNKIFDYMACGRPTILAIDGVAREVLEKAKAGEHVEPENPHQLARAVLKFFNNKDLITEYGKNARKYVIEHFDREKIAEYLNVILNEILNRNPLRKNQR